MPPIVWFGPYSFLLIDMSCYFSETNSQQWCVKDAYQELEREFPALSVRELHRLLKGTLEKLSNDSNSEKVAAALSLLQKWRGDNESTEWSWDSSSKSKKKSKLLKVYQSTDYGGTNFRGTEDKSDLLNETLSERRKLTLSFIFLISNSSSVLSGFSQDEKVLVMDSLDLNKNLKDVPESTVLTCHKMSMTLQKGNLNEDETNSKLDGIRISCTNRGARIGILA
ncbi:hypothetical protein HPULCUR_004755 [Helicostylum pulchrum]|uniref:Uncharacterized protein n=1 Tax=Helicostylum pulchrum TaxID=562976 RepID=A0ABP9XX42_9FUNG